MAFMSMHANDFRVVIKNGRLRLQMSNCDECGNIIDQVTVCLPKGFSYCFNHVEDFDAHQINEEAGATNRIKDYLEEDL